MTVTLLSAVRGTTIQYLSEVFTAIRCGETARCDRTFEGKPLHKAPVPEFIRMLSVKPVGAVVPIEFMRPGVKMSPMSPSTPSLGGQPYD